MWPAIYNFACIVTAVSCCAFAIKLADDYLDQEQDRLTGQANWTDILGIGTMFYAIFFIIIAAAIQFVRQSVLIFCKLYHRYV